MASELQPAQERQRLKLCLKHTINNLLQCEAVTAADLDRIANELTAPNLLGFSPHRTPVLGNYDANVLDIVMLRCKKVTTWVPIRQSASSTQPQDLRPQNPSDSAPPHPPPHPRPPPQQPAEQERQLQGQSVADPTLSGPSVPTSTYNSVPTSVPASTTSTPQPSSTAYQAGNPGSERAVCSPDLSSGAGRQRGTVDTDSGVAGVPSGLLSRPGLFGLVVNVRQQPAFAPWRWLVEVTGAESRHWLGLRCFGGVWYNLDSQLPAPEPFKDEAAVCDFLQHVVQHRGGIVIALSEAPS